MRPVLLMLVLASTVAAVSSPPLASYVGKYPFDKVRGVTFFRHPQVRSAMAQTVRNVPLRTMMLAPSGPSGLIESVVGGIKANGCEAHNCGDHQWSMVIAPRGVSATVCYHEAETMGDRSRWYLPSGSQEMRAGGCW